MGQFMDDPLAVKFLLGGTLPGTGATALTGFKVARVDRKTGIATDFVTHPMNPNAVIVVANGFNKPIDVHLRGPEMFMVDFDDFLPGFANVGIAAKSGSQEGRCSPRALSPKVDRMLYLSLAPLA